MRRHVVIKLIAFNLALILVNIAVFSNAFFKVQVFGGSILETLIGLVVIIGSVFLFIYVNYRIIKGRAPKIDPTLTADKITDLNSCRDTINRLKYSGTFSAKLEEVSEQISKMEKKKDLIKDILLQKFSDTEMSYGKFTGVVDSAEKVMCLNIKSMLNKICAFDEEEYNEIKTGKSELDKNIAAQKMGIYNEYIDYVNRSVVGNEEILLRLDKLLLEISKFNSLSNGELETMEALQELDNLIRDTKWYK